MPTVLVGWAARHILSGKQTEPEEKGKKGGGKEAESGTNHGCCQEEMVCSSGCVVPPSVCPVANISSVVIRTDY